MPPLVFCCSSFQLPTLDDPASGQATVAGPDLPPQYHPLRRDSAWNASSAAEFGRGFASSCAAALSERSPQRRGRGLASFASATLLAMHKAGLKPNTPQSFWPKATQSTPPPPPAFPIHLPVPSPSPPPAPP